MIIYEQGDSPVVRVGEQDLAGRRVASRAFPYVGDCGAPRFGFDPLERTFSEREAAGTVVAGPFDPEAWRAALAIGPAGAVLIGPSDSAERVRGAYRAAAEGAVISGRGAYLLDPDPEGLPETRSAATVAVFVLLPDRPAALARLAAAAHRGFSAGGLLPLIPGWTDSPDGIELAVSEAASAGARFVAPVWPVLDGTARRRIVETRAEIEPEAADDFFERLHHAGVAASPDEGRVALVAACRRFGLAVLPTRARGFREPSSNAIASAHLEEKAQLEERDEHRVALRHAAARWIDELGRDLAVIFREGNLRKIFPFGDELAGEAEAALEDSAGRQAHARSR